MKPYNFYLCPPLDTSERLVKMVHDNGGNVVHDFLQNCIVISSKDYPVPEDLKSAHIYSYEVIQDSANRGAQQEFANYLIHVPVVNESIPHQFSERKGVDDLNTDEYGYNNMDRGSNEAVERIVENHVDNDEVGFDNGDVDNNNDNNSIINNNVNNNINNNNVNNKKNNDKDGNTSNDNNALIRRDANTGYANGNGVMVVYDAHGVRYFTDEEDKILIEEIRKRHWMGIKGHSVYDAISKTPYFENRRRTPASLRERMRTLKYNVGYVYKTDKKNNLLKDSNGNYIKTTHITLKLTPYTAGDDLILCKTIYLKLDVVTDEKGFESVVFPTNFFDKFSAVYDGHTPESWRQRFKNYLSIFGITNYIKYYILEIKQDRTPLPANVANKEWLQARKHIKKTDCPRLYFPNVPQENEFINENLEYTTVPGYDHKIFEFDNPFRKSRSQNQKLEDESKTHVNKHNTDEKIDSTINSDESNPLNDENQDTEVFIDEPTTTFKEFAFRKSFEKYGSPIDLTKFSDRQELIKNITDIFDLSTDKPKVSPKELSKKLSLLGVKEYYTVFLIYRCNSNKRLVCESLVNYVKTDGKELLIMKPGVWSNKSMEWFGKQDSKIYDMLKRYHGAENYEKQIRSFKKSKIVQ